MTGIICALKIELEEFLKVLQNRKDYTYFDKTFYQGTINNTECVLTICGIGKVAAGITTSLLLEHFPNVDFIINSGIAGAYDVNLKTLDTIFAEKVGCYDIDMVLDGLPYGCFKEEERFFNSSIKAPEKTIPGIIMTSDCFAGNRDKLTKIFDEYYPDENVTCVDMESYVICQIAEHHNIKWAVIRTISDVVGQTDQISSYYNFPALASQKSFTIIVNNFLQ